MLITDRPGRRTDALGRPGANARTIAFAIVVVLAQACAAVPPAATVAAPAAALPPLQPVLIASELAVGEQRVPIGILDRNTPVNDATVHLRAYRQSATDPLLSESDAPFKGEGLQGKGAYVGHLRFSTVGLWHLEVTIRQGSRTPTTAQLQVNVLARSGPPAVGDAAPRSQNPTIRDVAQVEDLDSGDPPNDMHELSIAQAIAAHRPTLVVFATPAFCTSAMCGPQVHAVQALESAFRDRLTFIHVEIYQNYRPDPSKRGLTPTVQEWRLQSEPWVFLIDAGGVIRAAFEGPTATDEIRAVIESTLLPR